MLQASRLSTPRARLVLGCLPSCQKRLVATREFVPKKDGDISSVFRSLSGGDEAETLPARFADVKQALVKDKSALQESWNQLLVRIRQETEYIKEQGSACLPEIEFADIKNPSKGFQDALRQRGVAIVRQVVPEKEAREFKEDVEKYIATNPSTKAFPQDDPQVFELYWSPSQLAARSHPNMIATQKFLMSFFHSLDANAQCSTQQPLTYADRLRIRQPGDAGFALGPHVDGGSVERWEAEGYGRGHVYDKIFDGKWEEFDPWESSSRLDVKQDLYYGAGACSMFRMFQGWLGMSHTGPREGTLLVNPMLTLGTAYYLLRPFFVPKSPPPPTATAEGDYSAEFLHPSNWALASETCPDIQGAWPGHGQELNHTLHPHLNLPSTMVHVPRIRPGDYVAWHCDTIHAVDKVHAGKGDSSVMYIPACPTTRRNLEYVKQQRYEFIQGIPPSDFPGGQGESEHIGRPDAAAFMAMSGVQAQRSMGFSQFDVAAAKEEGEASVLRYGNEIMGF
jgi:uncharacterized protein YbaR (Trm112 family)